MARGLASQPLLSLTLLGTGGGQLASGAPLVVSKKAMALLAYLALAPCGACAREGLAALLWGETPETQARQSLRKTLSMLRQACAPNMATHEVSGQTAWVPAVRVVCPSSESVSPMTGRYSSCPEVTPVILELDRSHPGEGTFDGRMSPTP